MIQSWWYRRNPFIRRFVFFHRRCSLALRWISISIMLRRLLLRLCRSEFFRPRSYFASHRFINYLAAPRLRDSMTLLIRNFSSRWAFHSKIIVWFENSRFTTNETNAFLHVCLIVWIKKSAASFLRFNCSADFCRVWIFARDILLMIFFFRVIWLHRWFSPFFDLFDFVCGWSQKCIRIFSFVALYFAAYAVVQFENDFFFRSY